MFLFPVLFLLSVLVLDKFYETSYPVFSANPIKTIHHPESDTTDILYIKEYNSHYLIGIVYEIWNDDSKITQKTRWREKYPDYISAESALLKKYKEIIQYKK